MNSIKAATIVGITFGIGAKMGAWWSKDYGLGPVHDGVSAKDAYKQGKLFVSDEKAKSMRPKDGYVRIDCDPRFENFLNGHAIYDSLSGERKVWC